MSYRRYRLAHVYDRECDAVLREGRPQSDGAYVGLRLALPICSLSGQ